MKDTVIKGTGNSRTLRTVPNAASLYPTHESFIQALIDGTFPVDIGAMNPTGVDLEGTALSKANLLTDATAALYGKGDTATPNDIFAAIKTLINNTASNAASATAGKAVTSSGSYTGLYPNGGSGGVIQTVYLGINWKMCMILNARLLAIAIKSYNSIFFNAFSTQYFQHEDLGYSADTTSIKLSHFLLINSSYTYTYFAIGTST